MICGTALLAVGTGLYQLIEEHSPSSQWIGFQILSGVGYGMVIQFPILAVQIVLDDVHVPTGCVMVIFFQCLGGALATSSGQNVFADSLIKKLRKIEGLDVAAVVDAGAKDFRQFVSQDLVGEIIHAFQFALRRAFLLAMAIAAIAFASSWFMEWRKVPRKQDKQETAPFRGDVEEETVPYKPDEKQVDA